MFFWQVTMFTTPCHIPPLNVYFSRYPSSSSPWFQQSFFSDIEIGSECMSPRARKICFCIFLALVLVEIRTRFDFFRTVLQPNALVMYVFGPNMKYYIDHIIQRNVRKCQEQKLWAWEGKSFSKRSAEFRGKWIWWRSPWLSRLLPRSQNQWSIRFKTQFQFLWSRYFGISPHAKDWRDNVRPSTRR